MTLFAFTELFAGAVYEIDDLDDTTITAVGDATLSMPSGPSRNTAGAIAVAAMTKHEIAYADPGSGWTRFGTHGDGVGEFDRPAATEFLSSGPMLVLDAGNCRLVCIDDITGAGWSAYGHRGRPTAGDVAEGAFADPRGLAVDTSDRIWVTDPGANRVIRVDAADGGGWTQISLPAGANPTVPYGICPYRDGVLVVDVGNTRLLLVDDNAATASDLDDGTWLGPTFVTSLGDNVIVADVVANELRLLEPDGEAFSVAMSLRGSPPDVLVPLFDSLGGVGA
jgi:NHL repeat